VQDAACVPMSSHCVLAGCVCGSPIAKGESPRRRNGTVTDCCSGRRDNSASPAQLVSATDRYHRANSVAASGGTKRDWGNQKGQAMFGGTKRDRGEPKGEPKGKGNQKGQAMFVFHFTSSFGVVLGSARSGNGSLWVSGATGARLQGKPNNKWPDFSPVAQRRTVRANCLVR
jgi:hypothetical protein